MDVCLRVLKERNKTRLDSVPVGKSVLIISYVTFRNCRVHNFSDSRNTCKRDFILCFFVTKSKAKLENFCH